jgi:hypothetical protein
MHNKFQRNCSLEREGGFGLSHLKPPFLMEDNAGD